MKCSDYELLISIYADNELDDRNTAKLESHLAHCSNCKNIFEQTIDMQTSISRIFKSKVETPNIVGGVINKIHQKPKFRYAWALAAAVIIFCVLISYGFVVKNKKQVTIKPIEIATTPLKNKVIPNIVDLPIKAAPKYNPKKQTIQKKMVAKQIRPKFKPKMQEDYKVPILVGSATVSVSYEDEVLPNENEIIVANGEDKSDGSIDIESSNRLMKYMRDM